VHDGPLDLRLLAALDALVKRGSVSKAAEDLGVSQPTMSRTLARLREALDDEVLVRSGSRMLPTQRAREVADAARRALEDLENAIAGETFDPGTSARHFRIAAWDYTQRVLLGPLLAAIRHDAPGVSVEVVPVLDRSPIEALDAGAIDVSVGLHRQIRDGYFRCTLFGDRFVVCARPDHPLWDGSLTPERFAAAPHLLVAPFGATTRGAVDVALQALGLSRRVVTFIPNFASAPELLRETDLIATLPSRLVMDGLRHADPPLPLPDFEIEAVWHPRTHHDDAHRWFRDQLRTAARTA
jgi:DNA-binding transcriptional LysR family regulator